MRKTKEQKVEVSFRPYLAAYIVLCVFLGLYTLVMPLFIYLAFQSQDPFYIFFFVGFIFILGYTYSLYHRSRLHIHVNEESIVMENIKTKECFCAKWTDFKEAYRLCVGNNARDFIVLSKETLSHREQKDLYHRFSRSKKQPMLSLDGNIVFTPFTGHYSTIIQYITNKIPYHVQANEPRIWW